jgi:hypothetical protein
MGVTRVPSTASVIDVLDHVLDKGIVVDAWLLASIAGADLLADHTHVVVASIATHLSYPSPAGDRAHRATPLAGQSTLGQQLQLVRDRLRTGPVMGDAVRRRPRK